MTTVDRLIRSWEASDELHSFRAGATAREIQEFERETGWALPAEWRAFYMYANGGKLFQDNLFVAPLLGDDQVDDDVSLLKFSEHLRRYNWPIPSELWVAGQDGEGNPFGLWLAAATRETGPVVEVGQIAEPDCMAVAGSSLSAFLLIRTVVFLLQEYDGDPPPAALDALGVPMELRSLGPVGAAERWSTIARWADPTRPAGQDYSYAERLNAEEVNEALGCADDL